MRGSEVLPKDDVVDSRDVVEHIAYLEGERDGADSAEAWAEEWPDEAEELATLVAFAEEAEGYAEDWRHGATLIRDDYFETYARQVAEDIGALERCDRWPATCIDWEQAATELQQDYTAVEWGGVTYWVR